jgi:hypothetical protein
LKLEAIFHLTPNISYPLMMVVSALMLPVMIVRFYVGWWQMALIDFPLIVASFMSISAFYLLAQRELSPKTWKRSIFMLPALLAVGVALAVINSRAVMEALLGIKTGFVRTAKYAIDNVGGRVEETRYQSKSGWLPYIELAVGTYFLYMIYWAIDSLNFMALPFLVLFVSGYYWAAFATLYQEYRLRLSWQRRRRMELEAAR